MSSLRLSFDADVRIVQPSTSLTFGRRADLVVTANSDVADVVGRFRHVGGFWWLANQSMSHRLALEDRNSASVVTIPPGVEVVVAFASSFVDVVVEPLRYRLELEVELRLVGPASTSLGGRSEAPLNADQRLLLTALAERELRTGLVGELPTNGDVAERLGWSASKLHRKLDHLARKFSKLGVAGWEGSRDEMALDRRSLLVQHVLRAGLVTVADLLLLEELKRT